MATITNTDPNVTYSSLLTCGVTNSTTSNGITGTLTNIQDALGNNAALQVSTTAVNATGTLTIQNVPVLSSSTSFSLGGSFATGGTFATIGTFSSGGNFSTASTFTTAGAFAQAGAYATTLTSTATTNSTLPSGTHTLVGQDTTDTLTNKTLTTPIIASIKTNAGLNTFTLPITTDTAVGRATVDTLTNKTLTSPIIGQYILDTNSNILFNFNPTTSAVNYFLVQNAATGGSVFLGVTGTDSSINLALGTKNGNLSIQDTTNTIAPTLKFFNAANTFYVGLKAPALAAAYTWTLPTADAAGCIQSNGSGTLSIGTLTATPAIKSDQTTATSLIKAVVPGIQQNHPSAAKFWCSIACGASPTINASYNISSISRNGAGSYNLAFTTAFIGASPMVIHATPFISGTNLICYVSAYSASGCTITTVSLSGTAADPTNLMVTGFGTL